MKHKQAFTLIELLVVVLIIGILAAVALPQYQKAVERSRAAQALTMLKSVAQAAASFQMSTGAMPTSFDELAIDIPWTGMEKWSSVAGVLDTRSNADWSLQLYRKTDGNLAIYIGRLTGKYKGTGFTTYDTSGKINCAERTSQGIVFELADGEYCEKVMKGTRDTSSTASSFREYNLP